MGSHPLNLAIRFLLELAALVAMGVWGWRQGEGPVRYVLAISVPSVAAALWGIFAVPGDRSRSGSAPVAVSGVLRLGLEVAFFAFAIFAVHRVAGTALAGILALATTLHYAVSYDRLAWLLQA